MDSELNLLFDRIDQLGGAIFSKDRNGRYLSMNEAGSSAVGVHLHRIIGKTDEALFDASSAKLIMERDWDILSKNKTKAYSSLAQCGGEWKLFRSAKMVLQSSDTQPTGIMGVSFVLDLASAEVENETINCAFEKMRLQPREFQRAFLQRRLLSGQLISSSI